MAQMSQTISRCLKKHPVQIARDAVCAAIGGLWLASITPAVAEDGFAKGKTPLRYDVHFGAMLGMLEPVAGTIVCDARRDCVISLSVWPHIEVRLRASALDGQIGTAEIDCPIIECEFANGRTTTPYSAGLNDLAIYRGRGSNRIFTPLVMQSRETLGSLRFVSHPRAVP